MVTEPKDVESVRMILFGGDENDDFNFADAVVDDLQRIESGREARR